jgi:hypothetical protein
MINQMGLGIVVLLIGAFLSYLAWNGTPSGEYGEVDHSAWQGVIGIMAVIGGVVLMVFKWW